MNSFKAHNEEWTIFRLKGLSVITGDCLFENGVGLSWVYSDRQTAKFGQRPCLFHISNIEIKIN